MKGFVIFLLFSLIIIIACPLFAQQNQNQQRQKTETGIKTGTVISIIALVVSAIGWIVTYFLSIRAQNRNFVNQIKNSARLEIVKSVREYQDWLLKVNAKLTSESSSMIALQELNGQVDWFKFITELFELVDTYYITVSKWGYLLEEYEILFPKTTEVRCFLLIQDRKIVHFLTGCLCELRSNIEDFYKLKRTIEKIKKDSTEILPNQMGLMQDLLIYLQNICSFTHYKIPERVPQNLSLPRLISDKKGNIKITGEIKIPSQNEQ